MQNYEIYLLKAIKTYYNVEKIKKNHFFFTNLIV